jgi:hypothetical protein
MVPTGHTSTRPSFSLALGCSSGRILYGKVGFEDKTSHLNVCYFHDFKCVFTAGKKHRSLLSGQPSYL